MADLAIKAKIKSKLKAKLKAKLKKIAYRLERVPVISSLIRINNALQRLPDVIAMTDRLSHHDNFMQSVPVALRGMARDHNALRNQVRDLQAKLDSIQHQMEKISPKFDSAQIEKGSIEILSPEKLELHRVQGLRLNLGCGHIALPEYLNVDARALPGVDIVADVTSVPFGPSEVSEIFSSHVLEHFPQEQLRRQLLPYWASLLKSGGVFVAIVPDVDAMMKDHAEDDDIGNHSREFTMTSQKDAGSFQFEMFTPKKMEDIFLEAGLTNFEVTVRGRKNGACLEMEVRGRKG
jgi:predicted SAM-dependent methyltransferase